MPSKARAQRVGERIQEELSNVLRREVADPRLALVTITAVEVDRELAFATIIVSAMGSDDSSEEILEALEGAKGYLRTELAGRIPLRSFPNLRFRWDASHTQGTRIEELLAQIKAEEGGDGGEASEA